MSKLNIFKPGWIDMVFEGRNKKYGAYQLRSENPKTTVKAIILGAVLFSFVVALPKIYELVNNLAAKGQEQEEEKIIEVIELPPPPEEVPLPPPPPPVEQMQAPKSVVDEVKFKPLEAAKKEEVPEDPPKIEQFKDADPSSRDAKGDPNAGDINIDKPSGDLDKGVEVPDNNIYNTAGLQVQPEFPGGIQAFLNYVNKNFRVPELDQDMSVNIIVQFVVEKDGSITDIKAVRDPGYGMGKEAERVLKSIKTRWQPGIQNGKPVRARYSLPIKINIKS
ncbi:hypothetical protein CHU92_04695 [Flavobacterium cyanobacteriorum]|uniref:TonB C-terminal domain-containing protein n=1 Tax=Flavobacterium cyanobacteriorum TaxID=2022802 RepID=A0A255ZF59_9FLAO|nr:energy transducer TonB [Flavobacterium cyanobacteriorum]OYQ39544.1 hypothetical protein CHU92_04695 [Flavobacterium cyanobacteriorum]